MHRFFAHTKTKPSPCGLRCCGNRFANRIPRSCNRKGHTAQRMRRYVRHVERQATNKEVTEGIFEAYLDGVHEEVKQVLSLCDEMADREAWLLDHYAFGIHDDTIFRARYL